MQIADYLEPRVAARSAGQHPPHRLPPLLRPALHRRHRPARDEGRRRATTWSRATTSTSAAATATRQGIGRELFRNVVADRRARRRSSACSRRTSTEPHVADGDVPRVRPPARPTEALRELFDRTDRTLTRMTHHDDRTPMPVAIPVLPDSAPFTPAQRAWLNGFLAGLLSTRPAPAAAASAAGRRAAGAAAGSRRRRSPGTTRRWRWTSG